MPDASTTHTPLDGRPAGVRLIEERNRFIELGRRIVEQFPDVDDETLADTLEGATDLHEALAALIRSALDDEVMIGALKQRMSTLRARLDRLERRAAEKRVLACETMQMAHIRKLLEPDFTASLRQGPAGVDVMDEAKLPPEFLIPQPPKVDKRGVLEALNGGRAVPGAVLCIPRPSLSVRSQ